MDSFAEQPLLAWMGAMLASETLPEFARLAVGGPGVAGEDVVGAVLLADPGHELRRLAFGEAGPCDGEAAPAFVDSLAGVAPQLAALHAPWSGPYRAADHALLMPGRSGLCELLLLPLQRRSQLLGVYCLGARVATPALAQLATGWGAHVAALMSATLARHFDRARLLHSGMADPLTGWYSRRYLLARLGEEVARCRRQGTAASCLVVDVDRLHGVNERFGASAGDRVLHELGMRLEAQVRSSDTLAHLDGDQFAVLLPGTSAAQAVPLAERILAAVRAAPVEIGPGTAAAITVSIGIADAQPGTADERKAAADQWLADSLAALHRAKRLGGGGCEVSSAAASSAPGRSARRPEP